MRKIVLSVTMLSALMVGTAAVARAQVIPEFRAYVGAFLPTGDQRDLMKDAFLIGGQMGIEVAERLHVLGTFGFTPTENEQVALRREIGIYQYDVGLETFRIVPTAENWELRPFIGAGVGGRTYDPEVGDTETNFAGYGALGAEFQTQRVALRLEARDYLTRFKGLNGKDDVEARNDITMMVGAAFHW